MEKEEEIREIIVDLNKEKRSLKTIENMLASVGDEGTSTTTTTNTTTNATVTTDHLLHTTANSSSNLFVTKLYSKP